MGYSEALKAAGATIHDFLESGDYQGTWYAVVSYKNVISLVTGSYGSCSGCDAFQGEFDTYYDDDLDENEKKERLKEFGERYLQDPVPIEHALQRAEELSSWDMSADQLKEWLNKQHKLFFDSKLAKVTND